MSTEYRWTDVKVAEPPEGMKVLWRTTYDAKSWKVRSDRPPVYQWLIIQWAPYPAEPVKPDPFEAEWRKLRLSDRTAHPSIRLLKSLEHGDYWVPEPVARYFWDAAMAAKEGK